MQILDVFAPQDPEERSSWDRAEQSTPRINDGQAAQTVSDSQVCSLLRVSDRAYRRCRSHCMGREAGLGRGVECTGSGDQAKQLALSVNQENEFG